TKIPRSIAGNNANIWMTQMVTEPLLIDHLTTLHPHIIRFPGGSLSDVFFWNAPVNTPPADAPANLVLANGNSVAAGYWFGTTTSSWTCSVDNYYNMLQQTNNKGMITVNYGYARYGTGTNPVAMAAHLAADWVRYDHGRNKYWEVGNENFGDWEAGYRINIANNKDGQPEYLTGLLYGQHFKIFADSMRKAAQDIGKTIYIGAVMNESAPQSWSTPTATNWNTGLFTGAGTSPDFYIVHNYYTPYQTNASADIILATPEAVTQTMINHVKQSLTNAGIAHKPVILGEYNIFSVGSKQAVSNVNGLHAVMVIGEALRNKIGMTGRWDLANGWDNGNDHGMFNIGDEPDGVPKWNPRPVYYYMYFFQQMLGDRLVSSTSNASSVVSYASSFTSGETAVALINKSSSTATVQVIVNNFKKGSNFYWYKLNGGTDNGEFSRNVLVNGNASAYASGGPAGYKTISPHKTSTADGIVVTIPARGAVYLVIEKK
ncbi:MAG TPA: alpha-L-arabinofuranosidase, partial [Flavitalea sp.]|nr:alpha-L-arabinofuranosidase [Flavitalea sp.]